VVKRAEDIGLELGVRYLLEGSVQRAGAWVRITAQLIDAVSGVHVWAERYDRELKDIFALQDDVTWRIATVLQVKLAGDKSDYSGHEGTVSVEAHDALLRGLERFWRYTRESTDAAREHFANAVKLAPGYAAAHAWLARSLVLQWVFCWEPGDETLELAFEHARTAVDLDSQHPLAYSMLGWVQCWRKQGVAAIAAGRRAVALDPNNADAYIFLAITLAVSNRAAEGMRYVETGMRLNPHPSAFNQLALVFCYFVQERYEEAIAAGRRGVEVSDVFTPHHVWLSVAYIQLGRDDAARFHREKALALAGGSKPVLKAIWLDESLRLKFADLMQRAGLT
jgi:adenylate cyclase